MQQPLELLCGDDVGLRLIAGASWDVPLPFAPLNDLGNAPETFGSG
jgi:hypothetical protein